MHCYSGTDHTASFKCDIPVNCVVQRATDSLVTNLWNPVAALCGTIFWLHAVTFGGDWKGLWDLLASRGRMCCNKGFPPLYLLWGRPLFRICALRRFSPPTFPYGWPAVLTGRACLDDFLVSNDPVNLAKFSLALDSKFGFGERSLITGKPMVSRRACFRLQLGQVC